MGTKKKCTKLFIEVLYYFQLWIPDGFFNYVEETFHSPYHRPKTWKWGNLTEKYVYDTANRMVSVQNTCQEEIEYQYPETGTYPSSIIYPSGSKYHLGMSYYGALETIRFYH